MTYRLVKTAEEIEQLGRKLWQTEAVDQTQVAGMTFEDGLREMLAWLIDEDHNGEMLDEWAQS